VETSILATKLYVPPVRPRLVSRPRLFELLNEGLSYNLILVSAPAGFGKTTLVSEWVRQIQLQTHVAWVSLEEGENDPVHFWDYFIAALRTIQPDIGEQMLAMLHSHQSPVSQSVQIESILTSFINELTNLSFNVVLVLDDYHVITSQSVHDGLTFFLDHIPPRIHLIIASRADPPLPLTQYRGKGTILEIRTDDLRFSLNEASTLLRELQNLKLSPENISILNDRTEGWVTGLKMAAHSIPRQENVPEFLSTFSSSQRYIMDYLIEEVLKQQPEGIQDFLIKTSVLDRLNASLCDAVMANHDSQDILLELEHNNMFTNPLDETREWYRYEHLFQDLLNHQLEITIGASDITELHRRASQWYEMNNYSGDAIHHALIAHDWESAIRLITGVNEEKRLSGELVTTLNWIQRIPKEVIFSNTELCILYSQLLIATMQLDAATDVIDKLEQAAENKAELFGLVVSLRCFLAFNRGDTELALELGNKAISSLPTERLEMRTLVSMYLGFIFWQKGNVKESGRLLNLLPLRFSSVKEDKLPKDSGRIVNLFPAKSRLVNE